MTKLKDIAAELNISTSTVSRVVNNQDRVAPDTRKRVLEALKRHRYHPNENARRLKTNTSNVLGVIVPDISNPFYASVIKGIERGIADRSYSILLCNTDESAEREEEAVHLLMRQKVAGIIVASSADQKTIQSLYQNIECPVIFFDNVPKGLDPINSVTINNVRAARDMVRYMIDQGHQRIFMITGPAGESSADERLHGWHRALSQAGIDPNKNHFRYGDFREDSGYAIMKEYLDFQSRPTAVCVANNFMAYGAVKAIESSGLQIPHDISIGAFDVCDNTGLMRLSITTVIQPSEKIGMVAADLCLNAAKHESIAMSQKVILDHVFMPNATVAKL